jgi:hypothetical protein
MLSTVTSRCARETFGHFVDVCHLLMDVVTKTTHLVRSGIRL